MDAYFKSEDFDTIGFEESVWVRPEGGKYSEEIVVSAHVDGCLLSCNIYYSYVEVQGRLTKSFCLHG